MDIARKSKGYDLLKWLIGWNMRSSYCCVKVSGRENLPKDGAKIFAPNHSNTLMDPLLLLAELDYPVAFGARADMFRKPKTANILRWLRVVPLARERDGIESVRSNYEVFNEVTRCLKNGTAFGMYCEGTHNTTRTMLPFKKGMARIALQSFNEIGSPFYIIPTGVNYEYYFRYMGRVYVNYGEPIELGKWLSEHEGLTEAEIYRKLLVDLRSRMEALMTEYPVPARLSPLWFIPAVLSLPLFAACAVCASPVLIATAVIKSKLKDKAWLNTVRMLLGLVFFIFWPFHRLFYILLNFYCQLLGYEESRNAIY